MRRHEETEPEQSEKSEGEMSATADTAALQSAAKAPEKEKQGFPRAVFVRGKRRGSGKVPGSVRREMMCLPLLLDRQDRLNARDARDTP